MNHVVININFKKKSMTNPDKFFKVKNFVAYEFNGYEELKNSEGDWDFFIIRQVSEKDKNSNFFYQYQVLDTTLTPIEIKINGWTLTNMVSWKEWTPKGIFVEVRDKDGYKLDKVSFPSVDLVGINIALAFLYKLNDFQNWQEYSLSHKPEYTDLFKRIEELESENLTLQKKLDDIKNIIGI